MVKVVKEYDVADDIQQSNERRVKKGLRRITLDVLHTNQDPALAQHLKYDCAHRLLPKFRASPRNTPVHLEGRPVVYADA